MDDEIREALELTKEELLRMERDGEPANLAKARWDVHTLRVRNNVVVAREFGQDIKVTGRSRPR